MALCRARNCSSLASFIAPNTSRGGLTTVIAGDNHSRFAMLPQEQHEGVLISDRFSRSGKRAASAGIPSRPSHLQPQARCFHTSTSRGLPPAAPKSRDRGPKSDEDTQTDFTALNVLSNTPVPSTAIDACMDDGFALDSGLKVSGSGVLLLSGEAFRWRPWIREGCKEGTIGAGGAGDDNKDVASMAGKVQNSKRQFHVDRQAWGVLDLVWPKPDLLVLGTGAKIVPLSPETRQHINDLGIRVEVQDTRNAAAQFNLLATERGVQQVAAALVPIGWTEGK